MFISSSINVFTQTTSLISNCSDFAAGSSAAWPYVLIATTIDSGALSHGSQTFTINITSLPANGANFRVYKTTANGYAFFGNPVVLTLGSNSFTVPAVSFDRAVRFQFSSGDVEFNVLSLNGKDSDCVDVLPTPSSTLIRSCRDFVSGPTAWPYVLVATTLADSAASQLSQAFTMNVTSIPVGGAYFRVYKTTANGNSSFGNPVALTLGSNGITVPAVTFDRAVKFQFSSGAVEFDALRLNGVDSECVDNTNSSQMFATNIFLNTFPNPSNGDFFIRSSEPIEYLKIKDLSGKVVLEMTPKKSQIHIHTSQLKNYFYILSCYIKQKWITRKIILKQR